MEAKYFLALLLIAGCGDTNLSLPTTPNTTIIVRYPDTSLSQSITQPQPQLTPQQHISGITSAGSGTVTLW